MPPPPITIKLLKSEDLIDHNLHNLRPDERELFQAAFLHEIRDSSDVERILKERMQAVYALSSYAGDTPQKEAMAINKSRKEALEQKFWGYILGNYATWIADIGLKAGLFQTIADTGSIGISDVDLALQRDFDPTYVQVWCRAAYAFEWLEWDEQSRHYWIEPEVASLLLTLGGNIQFCTALYQDFLSFPTYLHTGQVWPRSDHNPLIRDMFLRHQEDFRMITEILCKEAPAMHRQLKEKGGWILDIGTGAGHALVQYAKNFLSAHIVGLDIDLSHIRMAQRTIIQANNDSKVGIDDRVEIRYGDANLLSDKEYYDLVTMNLSLHEMGEQYRRVLSRIYDALKPGGIVLITEAAHPDSICAYRDNSGPWLKLMASVQLPQALFGSATIPQHVLRDDLKKVGFTNVRDYHPHPSHVIFLAGKPTT